MGKLIEVAAVPVFFFYIEIVLNFAGRRVACQRDVALPGSTEACVIFICHHVVRNFLCVELADSPVTHFLAECRVDQILLFEKQKSEQSHVGPSPFLKLFPAQLFSNFLQKNIAFFPLFQKRENDVNPDADKNKIK